MADQDFDVVVVGSGFGGSTAALRLPVRLPGPGPHAPPNTQPAQEEAHER